MTVRFHDALADALVFLLRHTSTEVPVNVGTGQDVTIAELARTIQEVVGYEGELRFDPTRPERNADEMSQSSWPCFRCRSSEGSPCAFGGMPNPTATVLSAHSAARP